MTFRPETTGRSNPIARDFDRLRNTLRDNASAVAALPTGSVALARRTTDHGTFTTTLTTIPSLSITFDVVNGRTYRLSARVAFSSSAANDEVFGTIHSTLPVQMASGRIRCFVANQGYHMDVSVVFTADYTGSSTFEVRAQRVSGSGNITMRASAFAPAYILAEDLG